MPEVELRLYASLRRYVDGQAVVHAEIQSGETVGDLLAGFSVPMDAPRVIMVNSRAAKPCRRLEGGERVGVFPAIAGG